MSAPQPPADRPSELAAEVDALTDLVRVCDREIEQLRAQLDDRPAALQDGDHAGRAADHVLALVVAQDPTYQVTAESHDRMVELLQSVAGLLVIGRAR